MTSATETLTKARLYTDDILYLLVHLPAPAITAAAGVLAEIASPFSALIVDKDEVTLVLPQDKWEEFADRLPDHRVAIDYRLITFDLPLEFALVGFIALISGILAEAGVPIMPLAAYERDHILVPAARFQAAWEALRAAQGDQRLETG